jgi:hypothetical protein
MKRAGQKPAEEHSRHGDNRCNHPLAIVIDPTDGDLRELETMLAGCPNCSRWTPGDGPIMAVLLSRDNTRHEPKEIR